MIDFFGKEIQKIPYAVFLLGDPPSTVPYTYRHRKSPAIVSIQVTNNTYCTFTQVTVGVKKDKSPNTILYFLCPGSSNNNSHKLLLTPNGRVNRLISDVCMERLVNVGFIQSDLFKVDPETNEMIKLTASSKLTYYSTGIEWSYPLEQLSSFFQTYNLTPVFYDCNGSWDREQEMVNIN